MFTPENSRKREIRGVQSSWERRWRTESRRQWLQRNWSLNRWDSQNLPAKGEKCQVNSKQEIILLCGRWIFHTGLRNDLNIRNKYSPVNSRAFYRETGLLFQGHWNYLTRSDDHSQNYSLISDCLGPSEVRNGNRSDTDMK